MTSLLRSHSTAPTTPSIRGALSTPVAGICQIPPPSRSDGQPCALVKMPLVSLPWSNSRRELRGSSSPSSAFNQRYWVCAASASASPPSWCRLPQGRRPRRPPGELWVCAQSWLVISHLSTLGSRRIVCRTAARQADNQCLPSCPLGQPDAGLSVSIPPFATRRIVQSFGTLLGCPPNPRPMTVVVGRMSLPVHTSWSVEHP